MNPRRSSLLPVLVVDDEPSLLALYRALLERRGVEILTAASADEALALARALPVGVVISDYALGAKSGLDLLTELRADQPRLPFVLASVLFPAEVPDLALRAGADLVVDKNELLGELAGRNLSTAA